MFLRTLTLKGFKSFADATELVMEPGVTVVVGPNGSGKSNVVDAIGWVLGAQAPSAVRSQKMDDVIFAGTSNRPALGRAEVALTIDNTARVLPIDFSEITLTRTLFRTGDSEYAINGVPCRLLDVQELLSDSGVGRQQHVIISQGQIDAVLNARPEDRRVVIEEAAGVLKFRRRKEKAERRLASTEGNLTRLQDLLREVRRQLRPLERQADAARRYGSVVDELTALRIHVAGRDLVRLRSRLELAERTLSDLAAAERATRAELAELDASVVAAEAELAAMGGDDLGDDLARCESLRERARGLAALMVERRRGIDRDRVALVDHAQERLVSLLDKDARLAGEAARLDAARAEGEDRSGGLREARDAARAAEAAATRELGDAEDAYRVADRDHHAWVARAEALSAALDAAHARAGYERLAAVDGVVGTLADLVDVDAGWEIAFEAAAGEAMAAVVVADASAARRAIEALRTADVAGAVLPLAGSGHSPRAPQPRAVVARGPSPAPGAGRDADVDALLDHLIGDVVVVDGWLVGVDAVLADPERLVVTRDGDRFGPHGWRLGAGSAGATRAALDTARRQADDTAAAAQAAEQRAAAQRLQLDAARRQHTDLARSCDQHEGQGRQTADALARAEADRRELAPEIEALRHSLGDVELDAGGDRPRLAALEVRATATERLAQVVTRRVTELDSAVTALRERRRRQSEAARAVAVRLEGLRRARGEAEAQLTEGRERLQRVQLEQTETTVRVEAAVEAMRRDLDVEPDQAIAAEAPLLSEGTSPVARIHELERELRVMGPVNPLALEEFQALQERHEFLQTQLDDVKSSRRELARVIRAIDGEIVNVFAAAYADVATNFEHLFETLFPGGRGRLALTDPENLLTTGIEIEAKPSGKNVKKLSLLSGGERSLTALAYLFAVFRARPSPFYVMDEVEAALDDVNLHRFLDLVHEFRRDAQLIIVSHQKRTMEAADSLYGVTMEPGGSSKVLSERVTAGL